MKINELKRLLKLHGCHELKPGKEHDVWYSSTTKAKIRLPRHQASEIPKGTLKAILKQAGIEY